MPFLALDFKNSQKKQALAQALGVRGIPSLILFDAQGNLITKNGRGVVQSGVSYPFEAARGQ